MRKCTVCAHPGIVKINQALVAGTSLRHIAGQTGLSVSALHRHAKSHLPTALVKSKEAGEVADADDLLSQVRSLNVRTLSILSEAETTGKLSVALQAIKTAQGNIELLARMFSEIERHRIAEAEHHGDDRNDLEGMTTEELKERLRIVREMQATTQHYNGGTKYE